MPRLYLFHGLAIYFWTAENGEPVHVHVSKGRPTSSATKIWLTRNGGCVVANNRSRLKASELADVTDFVIANHADICERWRDYFHGDLAFYR